MFLAWNFRRAFPVFPMRLYIFCCAVVIFNRIFLLLYELILIYFLFQVLGVSFSPNGYLVATGSEDNFCRIWDLRKKQMLYSIPAHKSLISHVKFEPQEGYYLATSSYDTKAAVSLTCHLFNFIACFLNYPIDFIYIFHIFSSGQLGITNQSKVWWATSRR